MSGLIVDGKEIEVPDVSVRNFKDEPKLALRVGRSDGANDGGVRTKPVTLVVLHTTKGIPDANDKREQVIKPGLGPNTQAEDRTALYWATDPTPSGAHIVVDHDGSAACLADLKTTCAYHAGQFEVNQRSVGIEIFQGNAAEMYEGQLDVVRKIVDVITATFGVQRQIPDRYPNNTPIPRLQKLGGRDLFGVVGHRDVSDQRGKGDPGDAIMDVLAKNGYERFDFFSDQDKAVWKTRQEELLGLDAAPYLDVDGIPGSQTNAALKSKGYQYGLWALPPQTDLKKMHDALINWVNQGPVIVESLTPLSATNTGTGSGHNLFESLLDAFFPTLVAVLGGDVKKALNVIRDWLQQHQP